MGGIGCTATILLRSTASTEAAKILVLFSVTVLTCDWTPQFPISVLNERKRLPKRSNHAGHRILKPQDLER